MDAFFASVEQRNHPELRGKPIAVAHDEPRGVVSTASYEARKFGVRSAMPVVTAKRMCPSLVLVPPHFDEYKAVSAQIHSIFHDYTDLIEPISIDEAFLDVTVNKKNLPLAVDIAQEIRQRIRQELHLTASAGVSYNKFLAKIASDYRKPDGLTVIHPDRAQEFIRTLRIEQFWGVGAKTAEKMHFMGIFTGRDLLECSQKHLQEVFGKAGLTYYNFARGIDLRPVESEYVRKSVGCEQTFADDISTRAAVTIELYHAILELVRRIKKEQFEGRTLTLKVKYANFAQITRSLTQQGILTTKDEILPLAKRLLKSVSFSAAHPIRLLGLSVSNPSVEANIHREEWVEGFLEFED